MALAFLPVAVVRLTFNNLRLVADARLVPLFDYYSNQWLSTSVAMWNVYGEDLRTNNDAEGWHLRFSKMSGQRHPNIWNMIAAFQREQTATEVMRQQLALGQSVKRSYKQYDDIQRRIESLKASYDAGTFDAIQYVTGVSHNLAAKH